MECNKSINKISKNNKTFNIKEISNNKPKEEKKSIFQDINLDKKENDNKEVKDLNEDNKDDIKDNKEEEKDINIINELTLDKKMLSLNENNDEKDNKNKLKKNNKKKQGDSNELKNKNLIVFQIHKKISIITNQKKKKKVYFRILI